MPPASAPPSPAPAPRPADTLPADAVVGGLAFHRLLFARQRRGWWTPLAVAGIGVVLYGILMVVTVIVIIAVASSDPTVLDRLLALSENPTIDVRDPFVLALTLGTIVMMLPCYVIASRIVNGKRLGLISSAAGRLRWGWMMRCVLVALALYGVFVAISFLLPSESGADAAVSAPPTSVWVTSLVLILVLVPVQSATEEYVFRGYLMQSIGRWLRHPAWAILLPVPLFVLGHLYDVLGQINVGVFAIAAGWLSWRTGGLEAAIALHVVNNLTGFLVSLVAGTDPAASETGLFSFVTSLLLMGGFVAIVEWMIRRKPLPRTLVLTPPAPPAPPVGAVWTPPVWPEPDPATRA